MRRLESYAASCTFAAINPIGTRSRSSDCSVPPRQASIRVLSSINPTRPRDGADAIITDLTRREIQAVIPGRANRRIKIENDRALCRERNHTEACFGCLEINLAIATRYENFAERFLTMVDVAAATKGNTPR